jgi:two-component system alkaline phosphatase synthesis response regulator PhoP
MTKRKRNNFDDNLELMEQNYLDVKKFKILVIDKNKESVEHNIARFKNSEYKFIECYKSKDIYNALKKEQFDLVLLEVDLPDLDGVELCYELKNDVLYKKIPIVFLAERHDDYTQIAAYDAGCDDFIAKSSKSRLLVAKVKVILNRIYEYRDDKQISIKKYGNLEIDEDQVMVYKKGVPLKLSKKEFQLILLLTSKPGKVFRRTFILTKVWGEDIIVGDRNIDTHIKKLRKKIGKDHIQTVRGIGYKFQV